MIELVLTSLPEYGTATGLTLQDIQRLQFAGMIMSTAQMAGDDLTSRRYWRLPAAWQ